MRLGNGVIAAALLAMAPAIAAADSKVYLDIAGGANFLEATDISGTELGTEADFDTGFAVKAAIGNALDSGLRFEAEVAYRENDADSVGGSGGGGDVSAWSLMGNAIYDIKTGGRLTPYIGVGAGVGTYLGWMNLTSRRTLMLAFILLVLAGGVAGAYLGFLYGERAEPGVLGRRYTIDNAIHFGAAIGGTILSTILGLLNQWTRPWR